MLRRRAFLNCKVVNERPSFDQSICFVIICYVTEKLHTVLDSVIRGRAAKQYGDGSDVICIDKIYDAAGLLRLYSLFFRL